MTDLCYSLSRGKGGVAHIYWVGTHIFMGMAVGIMAGGNASLSVFAHAYNRCVVRLSRRPVDRKVYRLKYCCGLWDVLPPWK